MNHDDNFGQTTDGAAPGNTLYGLGMDESSEPGGREIDGKAGRPRERGRASQILARDSGTPLYYHQDRLGNVSAVTNGVGQVVEQYRYDAFGQPEIRSGPVPGNANGALTGTPGNNVTQVNNRFLFTGREWVADYGFYEYRNRAYNPALGRFMSEDPLGFKAGDRNLYRYCGGDPVNRMDPMGLEGEYFTQLEDANAFGRAQIQNATLGQTAKYAPVVKKPITHGMMVPVYPKGRGYEMGKLVEGTIVKRYNSAGQSYGIEEEQLTSQQKARAASLIHSHADKYGVGRPWSSDADIDLMRHGKIVERMDESTRKWHHGERANNSKGYQEKEISSAEKPENAESSSRSNSSRSSAADVDAAHQSTGVPSLGAEAINLARGPL